MAQVIEHLLSKQEALGSILNTTKTNKQTNSSLSTEHLCCTVCWPVFSACLSQEVGAGAVGSCPSSCVYNSTLEKGCPLSQFLVIQF